MKSTQEVLLLVVTKYKMELVFSLISLIIIGISTSLYINLSNTSYTAQKKVYDIIPSEVPVRKELFVDIEGAVINPGVYGASQEARIKDIVELAGGLSSEADKLYISRNINFSQKVKDQQKVYIPSITEVSNGLFKDTVLHVSAENTDPQSQHISINTATIDEIDTLPDIGRTIAQKIIDNRPYNSIYELVSKKVVKQATFNKIISLLNL